MRQLIVLVTILVWGTGCVTLQPVPLTVPESHVVEAKPLPMHPKDAELGIKGVEETTPIDEEECIDAKGDMVSTARPCPGKGGVLYSDAKSARMELYKMEYKQLRSNYEQDRMVWSAQRSLYEGRLKDAGEALQRARPSWLQAHAFELGLLSGVIVGVAASIGIVYGVVPAFKQSTTPSQALNF